MAKCSQTLDFRIDWGYQMLYSRRHYHPVYCWDGRIQTEPAARLSVSLLEYPTCWWGVCFSPVETPVEGNAWRGKTRRGLAGIRVRADCEPDTVFRLETRSGSFEFSARRVLEDKHVSFPVGPKYGFCSVTVCLTDHLWFRPEPQSGQAWFSAAGLPLPRRDAHRMRLAELAPSQAVALDVTLPEHRPGSPDDRPALSECLCHLQAMPLRPGLPDGENHVSAEIPLTWTVNGTPVARSRHYFRFHDSEVQLLEDVWVRFPLEPGGHRIGLKNEQADLPLYISRLSFEHRATRHLQLSLPRWALKGAPCTGRVFAVHSDCAILTFAETEQGLDLEPGWNSFTLSPPAAMLDAPVTIRSEAGGETGAIEAVYALSDETPEVMVGYDMTVVPHDDNGFMDWLLDYTARTQLGNTVAFRNFRRDSARKIMAVPDELLARWGAFCRRHRIHVQSVNCHESGALVQAAGDYMHNGGKHEYPGVVYALDPPRPGVDDGKFASSVVGPDSGGDAERESTDMKDACERYIEFLRRDVEKTRGYGVRPGYGNASGAHRHCYLAGASFIRTETMVPHTQHVCSQARPAAEALGRGDWGVHIALQHAVQPFDPDHHVGQYFLSLFQPWMMGANLIYEEDSLFLLFKEERQGWDDALTKGKRAMTRDFFRFVKTHPRTGAPARSIAFLEGRYAAPFNGFICGSEQDPGYSVWGKFGNHAPEWGHGLPEKCRHLLDVLMPGAGVHPLRQRFDRRRFFFSGTPYGDFDQAPIEASADYLQQYRLLLHLGWNTAIEEDYQKLSAYVENGGILFTGLPQFSRHTGREFLRDLRDLALWRDGDLSDLCGVRIKGPGAPYSGQWNAAGRARFPTPELSRLPNERQGEDGECRLADVELSGAEVVAWDAADGRPLVVRNRRGKGVVYLLCAWTYPGHEALSDPVSAWLAHLAEQCRDAWHVEDPSRDVFWNAWREGPGYGKMMLLNTDWARPAGRKPVRVHTPGGAFDGEVVERRPLLLTVLPMTTLQPDPGLHIEVVSCTDEAAVVDVHGCRPGRVLMQGACCREIPIAFNRSPRVRFRIDAERCEPVSLGLND